MPPLRIVRNAIAAAILGDEVAPSVRVGRIELHAHQRDALSRCRASLREFGGALLADEPGLGKTYVALALAGDYSSVVVCAPAALRSMWRDAAARAQRRLEFVSLEELSRRESSVGGELVVVDEAHRVSNPLTARYGRLARLTAGAHVLLLSATPLRNRPGELHAALALFLGPAAGTLDPATRARCIVRRRAAAIHMPNVVGPVWHRAPRTPDFAADIIALPAALPALDGRESRALLSTHLARCWASSLAAFDAALRRRLQRGAALGAALEAGRHPTRRELQAWSLGDDAMQLAFPALLEHTSIDAAHDRTILDRHLAAVSDLRERVRPCVRADAAARAQFLSSLRSTHPRARVVAFTAFAATAMAVYAALRRESGVAILTANGARGASGPRPRGDVLAALGAGAGPRRPEAMDDISLVISTDVLSEGVNLQGASVLVHLDMPWTPAALEQRVGRAVRLGSAHAAVHVHGIATPRAADRLIGLDRLFRRKHGYQDALSDAADSVERLRALLSAWRLPHAQADAAPATAAGTRHVACVRAPVEGMLAVVTLDGVRCVVAGTPRRAFAVAKNGSARPVTWRFTDEPAQVLALASAATSRVAWPSPAGVARAVTLLRRWLRVRQARAASGARGAHSHSRRRFLARGESLLASASPHVRALLVPRLVALRTRLAGEAGAGTEQLLLELSRLDAHSLAEWLEACEHRSHRASTRATWGTAETDNSTPGELVALLMLVSDATRPPPAPAPRRATPATSR